MANKQLQISPQTFARIGGLAYFIIIVAGILGEIFIRSKLIESGDAAGTARNISNHPGLWRTGIFGDLVMHVFDLVLAVVYYKLFKRVNKSLALLSLLFGMIQTAVLVTNKMNLVLPLFLLEDTAYLKSFSVAQLQELSYLAVRAHEYGFGIGLIFFGFSCLIDGYLIYQSRFLPRFLGVLIAGAGLSYLTNSFLLIFSPRLEASLFPVLLGPLAFIAEFSMCLWLIIRGVDLPAWESCGEPV